MIIFRRTLAVGLGLLFIVSFSCGLTTWHVSSAASDGQFLRDELRTVGAYDFIHDTAVPALIDRLIDDQAELLPDNLSAVALPTDAASRQALAALLREALPPQYLEARADELLTGLIPYLLGQREDFAIHAGLAEAVNALAAPAPSQRSALEATFRELNIGRAAIDGAIAELRATAIAALGTASTDDAAVAQVDATIEAVVGDRDEAAEWLTVQLFGAIEELRPYLVGEQTGFDLRVGFAERPDLAALLAPLLDRDAEELRTTGFVLSSEELRSQLGASGSEAVRKLEERLDVLRADRSYSATDLRADIGSGEDGETRLATLLDFRSDAQLLLRLRWLLVPWLALMLIAIALLGGRRWATRLAWAAAALMTASLLTVVAAGPLYDALAGPAISDALDDAFTQWDPRFASLRLGTADRIRQIVDGFVGGIAATALVWLALSTAALAGAAVWSHRSGMPPRDHAATPRRS